MIRIFGNLRNFQKSEFFEIYENIKNRNFSKLTKTQILNEKLQNSNFTQFGFFFENYKIRNLHNSDFFLKITKFEIYENS